MEKRVQLTENGQEVRREDINDLGVNAALADDRVLAEILRLSPFQGGSIAKAIVPFRHAGSVTATATVAPGTGGVLVYPFRAVVGTRSDVVVSSSDNWHDIRSAVYTTPDNSSLATAVALDPPTSSLVARWDLVYVRVHIDETDATESRYVKDPTSKLVAAASVVTRLRTRAEILVVKGTDGSDDPAAYPANYNATFPALPADSDGVYYNIALAYVTVPAGGGWTGSVARDIAEAAPIVPAAVAFGLNNTLIATGNNDPTSGAFTTTSAEMSWTGDGAGRPHMFIPPTMVGATSLQAAIALPGTSAAGWSHQNHGVVDARDWRNRVFRWFAMVASDGDGGPDNIHFPWSYSASTALGVLPGSWVNSPYSGEDPFVWGMGQSFVSATQNETGTIFASLIAQPIVCALGTHRNGSSPAGAEQANVNYDINGQMDTGIALYCDRSDGGKLKVAILGTPRLRYFLWLDASAPYPNY